MLLVGEILEAYLVLKKVFWMELNVIFQTMFFGAAMECWKNGLIGTLMQVGEN